MNRIRLFRTTVFRLALLYAGLFSLVAMVVLAFIYWSTTSYIATQTDTGLKIEADGLAYLLQGQGPAALRAEVRSRAAAAHEDKRRYLLVAPDGARLAGNVPAWPAGLAAADAWATVNLARDPGERGDPGEDNPARVLTRTLPGGYRLLIGRSVEQAQDLSEHILGLMLAALGITAALALAGGALMGRSVLRRIDAVSGTAGEIMAGDLSRRIPVSPRNNEFDELAGRLNAMLARLEQLMAGMREVSDNVAHDLRGPLTRLHNRLEVTLLGPRAEADYRAAIAQAIEDADGLIQTFNALLSIAQAEAGVQRNHWSDVDLGAMARDLGELYEAVAEDRGLAFTTRLAPGVRVAGNPHLLAQAVSNLLDNATKYTPRGGQVALEVSRRDGAPTIAVADTGPGIPPQARARVLERFVRLDAARTTPGSGLGLSLVNAVARLHGARLQLEDNAPGLRVSLTFPQTPA